VASDGEVIRRSLEDPSAFSEIFERYFDDVARYARRRVGAQVGEEIAAQTFVVAFERRQRFNVRYGSARPWLMGIATNLVRHHFRAERTHLTALARLPADPPAPAVDDPTRLDAQRLRPALAAALLDLADVDRNTFLLVALGELSYGQAAAAQGIPVGTVRSRLHRARTRLRELLGNLAAIPEQTNQGGAAP
jgi:RNA polymerase sigma-70 factor (ECF subfamily)